MASGGAERLHLHLAPYFMQAGYRVTFLLHRAEGSLMPIIPQGARVVSMECGRTLAGLWPLIRFLRKEKPDILLSNLGHNNIIAIWAKVLAKMKTRVIACFHSVVSAETSPRASWQYRILPLLCRLFLNKADGIVAVSSGSADDLARVCGIMRQRIDVIYNPAVFERFDERMQEVIAHSWLQTGSAPVFLAVGRLVESKDFPILLRAFALVKQHFSCRLIVLGEGPQHGPLKELARSLHIDQHIDLLGYRDNPLPFMRRAAAVIMTSRYEGFGNVLVEALACGTPVISTDCPYGPAEILDHGRFGTLVPVGDVHALAQAMQDLLKSQPDPHILQSRGREFTADRTAQQYIALFNRIGG